MSDPLFDVVIYGILLTVSFYFIITYRRTRLSIKFKNKTFLNLKKDLKFEEQQNKINTEKLLLADNLNKLSSNRLFEITKELIRAYQLMYDKKPN